MVPNSKFLNQSNRFWAYVRAISEKFGYTRRNTSRVSAPTESEVMQAVGDLGLSGSDIKFEDKLTSRGHLLIEYFHYRADTLNNQVKGMLMDAEEARALFQDTRARLNPKCPLPMNKQKAEKRAEAYLTCLVNMLIESAIGERSCDYDPRKLTKVTDGSQLLSTLSRRVDGAFPSTVNPIAIWEIKEYYYTTTFGSRVADGVYETLLDGMELRDLRVDEGIHVNHYLMVDSYRTWWSDGRSYLCRILDMMHMGYVDEVVFGREVIDRIPILASEWREQLEALPS
ncbi:MAG: hypothetical protein KTV68_05690 [Acidimicrobiia bacterium]|nr:hypothetical protein [Acidimicrobiia bacterium]MCY4434648.1 hypothetical protein [bacterium]